MDSVFPPYMKLLSAALHTPNFHVRELRLSVYQGQSLAHFNSFVNFVSHIVFPRFF
jgi:hypothetical protein